MRHGKSAQATIIGTKHLRSNLECYFLSSVDRRIFCRKWWTWERRSSHACTCLVGSEMCIRDSLYVTPGWEFFLFLCFFCWITMCWFLISFLKKILAIYTFFSFCNRCYFFDCSVSDERAFPERIQTGACVSFSKGKPTESDYWNERKGAEERDG